MNFSAHLGLVVGGCAAQEIAGVPQYFVIYCQFNLYVRFLFINHNFCIYILKSVALKCSLQLDTLDELVLTFHVYFTDAFQS